MIPSKRARIYSKFEIDTILFFGTMMMFLPILLVFTFIFDIDQHLDVNRFIFVSLLVNLVVMVSGSVFLLVKKDHLKRQIKPNYQNEYIYLAAISVFGIFGFVVFYDYMGGNRDYIANILVVLVALLVYILMTLGRKFFKFDYMKKK